MAQEYKLIILLIVIIATIIVLSIHFTVHVYKLSNISKTIDAEYGKRINNLYVNYFTTKSDQTKDVILSEYETLRHHLLNLQYRNTFSSPKLFSKLALKKLITPRYGINLESKYWTYKADNILLDQTLDGTFDREALLSRVSVLKYTFEKTNTKSLEVRTQFKKDIERITKIIKTVNLK